MADGYDTTFGPGQPQAWPWALGLLTAILGGGAGLSAIAVFTVWLGHLAVTRLADRQVSVLHALAGPA